MPEAVLVEFVTPDRFHGAALFPFVQGLLRARGVGTRWLRFAIDPGNQFRLDEHGQSLPDDDLALLVATLRERGATHALFFPLPAASVVRAVVGAVPGLRAGVMSDALETTGEDDDEVMVCGVRVHLGGDGALRPIPSSPAAVLAWFGVAPEPALDGRLLQEAPAPDYDHTLANEGARTMVPFVPLLTDKGCTYLRRLADSAFFEGRADPGLPERWGCTFCMMAAFDQHARTSPEELLATQLRAVAATHPPTVHPLRYRLTGAHLGADPVRLAELFLAAPLRPGALLVDYRADALARLETPLRTAATLLAAAGFTLRIYLVGVESFSARQLDRYHKGFPPETSLAAVRVLRTLEHELPGAFSFREYGGLSTILCDPWAGPGDIALNLAVVRHFRLEKLCGKLLVSKLRLNEGMPLTIAARADGLLAEAYADPAQDTARRNFYPDEIPWRFADPRLDALNRLLVRLPPDPTLAGDALHEALVAWGRESGLDDVARAARLVHALQGQVAPLPPEALLARARGLGAPAGGEVPVEPPREDDGPSAGRAFDEQSDVAAFRAGLKPVLKLEGARSPAELETMEAALRARWPDIALRRRRPVTSDGRPEPYWELFAGHTPAEVEEAAALKDRTASDTTPAAIRATLARTGALLGYPSCCAEAFGAAGAFYQTNNGWLHVRRRLDAPRHVDPAMHPVLTGYVPCRLDCPTALAQAHAIRAHLPATHDTAAFGYPTLLLLDRPGDHVVLRPLTPPGPRFRYEVAMFRTADARLAALLAGDTLEVEPGLVRVLVDGHERAWFALDAFLWWHADVFHADFWRECLREREAPSPDGPADTVAATAHPPEPPSTPPADPEARRRGYLRGFLAALLDALAAHPKRPLRGFVPASVVAVEGPSWGELRALLVRGPERLGLRVVPRAVARHAFCTTVRFALVHDEDTPADTDDRRRVLQVVARALEAQLGADV